MRIIHSRPVLSAAVLAVLVALAGPARAGESIEAVTKPSKDLVLSFVKPGLIAKLHVKQGDHVTAGQVLAELDDQAEQVQLEQLQAQAADTTHIQAARAELEQARVELAGVKEAHKRNSATILEVQRSELQVQIAELTLKLRQFEHEQEQRKVEQARKDLERMKLRSPVDGTVEELVIEAGEAVDALKPVMRVTNIDPLWIDAPVPLERAAPLKVGDPAEAFSRQAGGKTLKGKIIHIASEADPASETLPVRIELPNPEKYIAGETVEVRLPQAGKATSRKANQPPAMERPS